jgi:hypothetical protein
VRKAAPAVMTLRAALHLATNPRKTLKTPLQMIARR